MSDSDYAEVQVFRGSCPNCGVFQTHKMMMCVMPGCLTLHYYPDVKCACGTSLQEGNMP